MTDACDPRVSVVVPCHQGRATLGETLRSILSQSFSDLEVVVVDDGSTDDPAAIVETIGDPRLRMLRIEASGGPSRPRNVGVRHSRGALVFFCDADDVMLPGKIERQVRVFDERPDVGMVFTDFRLIDAAGNVIERSHLARFHTLRWVVAGGTRPQGGYDRDRVLRGLFRANFVGTSSVAVRREAFDRAGGFDESLPASEDFDLWVRMAERTDVYHLDVIAHSYRRHRGSIMHRRSVVGPEARIEVLRRQMERATDGGSRDALRRRMLGNHVGAGYLLECEGDWEGARRHYLSALELRPGWPALWGLLKTTSPLRRLAARVRHRRRPSRNGSGPSL